MPADFISKGSASMSACLSPAYLAKVDQERKQCEAEIQRSKDAKANNAVSTSHGSQSPQLTWGTGTTEDTPHRKRRTKAKLARALLEEKPNTATPLVSEKSGEQPDMNQPDMNPEQPTRELIAVNQASLSVFKKMFYPDRGNAAIR